MSEMYEGVVFHSDEPTARRIFGSLSTRLRLRLVRLASDVFGVYRVADRPAAVDQPAVERVAEQVSEEAGQAVALFYDNRCGVRAGVLYARGRRDREFGDGDARWVPYGEDGELVLDGPRLRESQLQPDEDYDCIFTAIDAALEAVRADPRVSALLVKQAFCYDESEVLAECGSR
jgi:hypothetical protein